jgi:hypothetical protein
VWVFLFVGTTAFFRSRCVGFVRGRGLPVFLTFCFRASWLGTGRPVARSARRCGRENAKRVRDRPVQGFFYRPLDFLPVPGGNGIYRGIPLEFKFQTKTDSYR